MWAAMKSADAEFRAKPVTVRAIQMTENRIRSNEEWPDWLHEAWNKGPREEGSLFLYVKEPRRLAICTPEGAKIISSGDYLILGTRGEIYPCKPDVFEGKYELV
jgi:hypothetical protein